jgi:hypothetical protein
MAQMARKPTTPTDAPTATAVLFREGVLVAVGGMTDADAADAAPVVVDRLLVDGDEEDDAEEHDDPSAEPGHRL